MFLLDFFVLEGVREELVVKRHDIVLALTDGLFLLLRFVVVVEFEDGFVFWGLFGFWLLFLLLV